MLIKYIKSFLWRVAKRLSYIEDARRLKVKKDKCWKGISEVKGYANCIGIVEKIILKLISDKYYVAVRWGVEWSGFSLK